MEKKYKILKTLLLLETILLAVVLICFVFSALPPKSKTHGTGLNDVIEPGYSPANGFVPDAETAAAIGGDVIDSICGRTGARWRTSVYYDGENQAWAVSKFYFGHPGGVVYIDQQTGAILKFLFYEN